MRKKELRKERELLPIPPEGGVKKKRIKSPPFGGLGGRRGERKSGFKVKNN